MLDICRIDYMHDEWSDVDRISCIIKTAVGVPITQHLLLKTSCDVTFP